MQDTSIMSVDLSPFSSPQKTMKIFGHFGFIHAMIVTGIYYYCFETKKNKKKHVQQRKKHE